MGPLMAALLYITPVQMILFINFVYTALPLNTDTQAVGEDTLLLLLVGQVVLLPLLHMSPLLHILIQDPLCSELFLSFHQGGPHGSCQLYGDQSCSPPGYS